MEFELGGKTALVTGSSRGIGFAIAASLYREGCCVMLNGRREPDLARAVKDLPGSAHSVADMTRPEEACRAVSEAIGVLGNLDILVCNVGNGRSVPPGTESAAEWQRMFAINLWSATNAVEAARDSLARSKGVILCISSICGIEAVSGAPITYSAAKAALNAYVRGIARPLGRQGVRINALAPGNVLFNDSVWARRLNDDPSAVQAMLDTDVSLGKLGALQDVADVATYLVSPRARFVTGSIWAVDGGQIRS